MSRVWRCRSAGSRVSALARVTPGGGGGVGIGGQRLHRAGAGAQRVGGQGRELPGHGAGRDQELVDIEMHQPVDPGPAIGAGGVDRLPRLVRLGAPGAAPRPVAGIGHGDAHCRVAAQRAPRRRGVLVEIEMEAAGAEGDVVGREIEDLARGGADRRHDAPARAHGRGSAGGQGAGWLMGASMAKPGGRCKGACRRPG